MEIYNAELGASSMTMSLGTKPKLLFLYQGFAILMGLASMVAALPVAALSFVCYGAAMLLGRVRPLRNAYEFLSRSYDGILERRGQNVLRHSRAATDGCSQPYGRADFRDATCFRETAAAAGDRFLSFSLRPEISAVCEDVQRQPHRGAPAPGLLFREMG